MIFDYKTISQAFNHSDQKEKRMRINVQRFASICLLAIALLLVVCVTPEQKSFEAKDGYFSFIVNADMRQFAGPSYQTSEYFLGTCEAILDAGKGAFMVSVGDIDPPEDVRTTIDKILGSEYVWYPVVGNHEDETWEDMAWLRDWGRKDIPNLTRRGPKNGEETTYSFDFGKAHFAVINQYYNGESDTLANGDICESLYQWLKNDLEANSKPYTFVFGHEPIVSIPDFHSGRQRHIGDSLNAHPENNHRFQKLLRKHNVTAYFCGHSHNFSFAKINGLWQIDTGHCRGIGDKEAPSTFLKIEIGENSCRIKAYR
ncbi:MAG TPA: hypothetical protein ENH82_12625, partial [bacterium]|nr:hypothetical protein [bacterium]